MALIELSGFNGKGSDDGRGEHVFLTRLRALSGVFLTQKINPSVLQNKPSKALLNDTRRLLKLEQTYWKELNQKDGPIDEFEDQLKSLEAKMAAYKSKENVVDAAWEEGLAHTRRLIGRLPELREIPGDARECTECWGIYPTVAGTAGRPVVCQQCQNDRSRAAPASSPTSAARRGVAEEKRKEERKERGRSMRTRSKGLQSVMSLPPLGQVRGSPPQSPDKRFQCRATAVPSSSPEAASDECGPAGDALGDRDPATSPVKRPPRGVRRAIAVPPPSPSTVVPSSTSSRRPGRISAADLRKLLDVSDDDDDVSAGIETSAASGSGGSGGSGGNLAKGQRSSGGGQRRFSLHETARGNAAFAVGATWTRRRGGRELWAGAVQPSITIWNEAIMPAGTLVTITQYKRGDGWTTLRGETGSHHDRLIDEDAMDKFIPEMDRSDEFVVITWGSGQRQHMPAHTVRWLFWSDLDLEHRGQARGLVRAVALARAFLDRDLTGDFGNGSSGAAPWATQLDPRSANDLGATRLDPLSDIGSIDSMSDVAGTPSSDIDDWRGGRTWTPQAGRRLPDAFFTRTQCPGLDRKGCGSDESSESDYDDDADDDEWGEEKHGEKGGSHVRLWKGEAWGDGRRTELVSIFSACCLL